jgi:hypothetical protein
VAPGIVFLEHLRVALDKVWHTGTRTPSLPGVGAVFLGNDLKNWPQIVGVTLRYKFE